MGCQTEYSRRQRIKRTILARMLKQKCIKLKGDKCSKCSKCGYDKCIEALEFHHNDPSKKLSGLSQLILKVANKQKPFEYLKTELDKCTLLCSKIEREKLEKDELYKTLSGDNLCLPIVMNL